MKKIILLFAFAIIFSGSFAQRYTLVGSGADTLLTDAQTKYYTVPAFSDLAYGSFGVYLDHLTGSTDSSTVDIQGSFDNSYWTTMGYNGASVTATPTSAAPTSFNHAKMTTTSAGFIWNITAALTLPYYRFKIQHYGTGTVRVRAWMYIKK